VGRFHLGVEERRPTNLDLGQQRAKGAILSVVAGRSYASAWLVCIVGGLGSLAVIVATAAVVDHARMGAARQIAARKNRVKRLPE
jgi:cytochrome c biogenesis protein CcdA